MAPAAVCEVVSMRMTAGKRVLTICLTLSADEEFEKGRISGCLSRDLHTEGYPSQRQGSHIDMDGCRAENRKFKVIVCVRS